MLLLSGFAATSAFAQPRPLPTCHPWQRCQQLALEAAARGDGEGFHDLAWRTVQIGPSNNPELLWLLARAQSASGRPHDALVLVRRLADMGVATTADTDSDFARTRDLPGWADVAALLNALRAAGRERPVESTPVAEASRRADTRAPPGAVTSSPASPTTGATTAAEAATAVAISPTRVRDQPLRFLTSPFTAGGLAYDTVSRRFVVGDTHGRRVMVVGLDTGRAVDMVRSDSARFHDVADIGIDQARGDLWVTSRQPGGESALHRLQLISGRPLRIYHPPAGAGSVQLGDLAIGPSGLVVVLDRRGRRLMTPTSSGLDLRVVTQLAVDPISVTMLGDRVALVAHPDGIVRVDVTTGATRDVSGPEGGATAGFERIRAYRDGLVGVQRTGPDTRRLVFLPLRRNGARAGVVSVLDVALPSAEGPPFLSVLDDEIAYLVTSMPVAATSGAPAAPAGVSSVSVIHRLRLE